METIQTGSEVQTIAEHVHLNVADAKWTSNENIKIKNADIKTNWTKQQDFHDYTTLDEPFINCHLEN